MGDAPEQGGGEVIAAAVAFVGGVFAAAGAIMFVLYVAYRMLLHVLGIEKLPKWLGR